MKLTRRALLAGSVAAATASLVPTKKAEAAISGDSYATLIDLELCDGCPDRPLPACVTACRETNKDRFPEPDPAMLKPYWPRDTYEDWSGKRDVTNRLTPYNWTFVQKVEVEHDGERRTVHIPRRCMHCDNPPCAKLCPFGIKHKNPDGIVTINVDLCFGGAKCRDVCPWKVPQRQAGVGLYTYLDPMPVGGGAMFKCDLCRDRLHAGLAPGCIPACPKKALSIGTRTEIFAQADELAKQYGGHLYGKEENGGTSTIYVSRTPFEKINAALTADKEPGKVMRLHRPDNMLDQRKGWAWAALAAPVIGAVTAFVATARAKEEKK